MPFARMPPQKKSKTAGQQPQWPSIFGINRPPKSKPSSFFALQRTAGNRAVTAMLNRHYRVGASSGQPLDPATQSFAQSGFGHDFSKVRVHTDDRSAQMARVLRAKAFTFGTDIFFSRGSYAPQSHSGRRILAHELTHVLQQSNLSPEAPLALLDDTSEAALTRSRLSLDAGQQQGREGAIAIAHDLATQLAVAARTAMTQPESTKAQALEQDAERAAEKVSRGEHVEAPTRQTSTAILRLPDSEDLRASRGFYNYLEDLEQREGFPLLSVILASPTLRPYDVETAARAGTLLNFSQHPGSTFLGAVGQALIWRQLKYQSAAGLRGTASTHVFPEPVTLAAQKIGMPQELTPLLPLIGELQPDLIALLLGGQITLGPVKIRQDPELNDIVDPTTGRLSSRRFSASTVIAFLEITTSTQWRFIQPRAVKVAAWASVLNKAKLPRGLQVIALLAMDRGAYFSLPAPEREALHKTLAATGGAISLHRDLTKISVADARILAAELAKLSVLTPSP